MVRKLKVFQTQLGFYDSVVAAPSQAAALEAWGTHHNLFADGMARLATDEDAIEAARQQPGVPLKRAIGTTDAFGLNPGLPQLPDMPKADKRPKAKLKLVASQAEPKPRPKPADRSALDRAEAVLRGLDESRRREVQAALEEQRAIEAEERALAQRRKEHEARGTAAEKHYAAARSRAEYAAERERKAYEKAGGR